MTFWISNICYWMLAVDVSLLQVEICLYRLNQDKLKPIIQIKCWPGRNCECSVRSTVKQVNFADNLILRILRTVQIRQIRLLQNCKFYIDNIAKFSIFAKSSCHWIGNNFQFAKKKQKQNKTNLPQNKLALQYGLIFSFTLSHNFKWVVHSFNEA